MSNGDIKKMDNKEFELYESNRMEKNAWSVAEELQRRLDDAPILGEYIGGVRFLTEKSNDGFFLNWTIWQGIWKFRRQNVKTCLFQEDMGLLNAHYNTGELFMEYLKKGCINKHAISASHTTGWDQTRKEYLRQFQIPITLVPI